jgi:hypothetical protein
MVVRDCMLGSSTVARLLKSIICGVMTLLQVGGRPSSSSAAADGGLASAHVRLLVHPACKYVCCNVVHTYCRQVVHSGPVLGACCGTCLDMLQCAASLVVCCCHGQ